VLKGALKLLGVIAGGAESLELKGNVLVPKGGPNRIFDAEKG